VKKEFFFDDGQILIINEDIFTTKKIAPESIDLVVTSPPYNVDIKYSSHDDQLTYDQYLTFSRRWMRRCFSWLKNDGRFCLNIPLDKNKSGQQSIGADLTTIAKKSALRITQRLYGTRGISRAGPPGDPGQALRHRM
jgi:site-specific DNA-methyltransferase (adenine-specific)